MDGAARSKHCGEQWCVRVQFKRGQRARERSERELLFILHTMANQQELDSRDVLLRLVVDHAEGLLILLVLVAEGRVAARRRLTRCDHDHEQDQISSTHDHNKTIAERTAAVALRLVRLRPVGYPAEALALVEGRVRDAALDQRLDGRREAAGRPPAARVNRREHGGQRKVARRRPVIDIQLFALKIDTLDFLLDLLRRTRAELDHSHATVGVASYSAASTAQHGAPKSKGAQHHKSGERRGVSANALARAPGRTSATIPKRRQRLSLRSCFLEKNAFKVLAQSTRPGRECCRVS